MACAPQAVGRRPYGLVDPLILVDACPGAANRLVLGAELHFHPRVASRHAPLLIRGTRGPGYGPHAPRRSLRAPSIAGLDGYTGAVPGAACSVPRNALLFRTELGAPRPPMRAAAAGAGVRDAESKTTLPLGEDTDDGSDADRGPRGGRPWRRSPGPGPGPGPGGHQHPFGSAQDRQVREPRPPPSYPGGVTRRPAGCSRVRRPPVHTMLDPGRAVSRSPSLARLFLTSVARPRRCALAVPGCRPVAADSPKI